MFPYKTKNLRKSAHQQKKPHNQELCHRCRNSEYSTDMRLESNFYDENGLENQIYTVTAEPIEYNNNYNSSFDRFGWDD